MQQQQQQRQQQQPQPQPQQPAPDKSESLLSPVTGVLETVDIVIVHRNKVLFLRRVKSPCKYALSLPGGIVDPLRDADVYAAAHRKLYEKTGLRLKNRADMRFFRRFADASSRTRDPRSPSATSVFIVDLDATDSDVAYDGCLDLQKRNPPNNAQDQAERFQEFPWVPSADYYDQVQELVVHFHNDVTRHLVFTQWDDVLDVKDLLPGSQARIESNSVERKLFWVPLSRLVRMPEDGAYGLKLESYEPLRFAEGDTGKEEEKNKTHRFAFDHGLLLREVLQHRHDRRNYRVIVTLSHPELGRRVADLLGVRVIPTEDGLFANGESAVKLGASVRDLDIILVATGSRSSYVDRKTGQEIPLSLNDNNMELQLLAHGCRQSGARSITVVLAHFPYARSDKRDHRGPIGARHQVDLFERMGIADRLIAVDLHSGQTQACASLIPFDNLYANEPLQSALRREMADPANKGKRYIVVSPDLGGVKRAENYANNLGLGLVFMNKHRNYQEGTVGDVMAMGGVDPAGKVCIVVDDMIDTFGTGVKNIEALEKLGASEVLFVATHGLFSGASGRDNVVRALTALPIPVRIVCTDTVPLQKELVPFSYSSILTTASTTPSSVALPCKINVVSVDSLLCRALSAIIYGGSLSQMFVSSRS